MKIIDKPRRSRCKTHGVFCLPGRAGGHVARQDGTRPHPFFDIHDWRIKNPQLLRWSFQWDFFCPSNFHPVVLRVMERINFLVNPLLAYRLLLVITEILCILETIETPIIFSITFESSGSCFVTFNSPTNTMAIISKILAKMPIVADLTYFDGFHDQFSLCFLWAKNHCFALVQFA